MARLTVSNVDDRIVAALQQRAAEHSEILRAALLEESFARGAIASPAASDLDSTALVHAHRDGAT